MGACCLDLPVAGRPGADQQGGEGGDPAEGELEEGGTGGQEAGGSEGDEQYQGEQLAPLNINRI